MVEVKFKVTGDVVRLTVDGVQLPIDGTATKNVTEGEHPVHWFVRGDQGDDFTIEVVKPASIARKISGTLDSSKQDAGTFWFAV